METSLALVEQITVEKMVRSYEIIKAIVKKHFDAFMMRISISHNLPVYSYIFGGNDVVQHIEDLDTKIQVSIIPLVLHMLAAIV